MKALNDCAKLPRFILVVPDLDLLQYLNYFSYGVEDAVFDLITWVVSEMKQAAEDKKDQLFKFLPGAIKNTEPKFVWVKMLKRMKSTDKIFTVRGKYNDTLEKLLADYPQHYIIDPNLKLDKSHYYSAINILNEDGKSAYWREIDDCIKMFEDGGLKLKPRRNLLDEPSNSAAAIRY